MWCTIYIFKVFFHKILTLEEKCIENSRFGKRNVRKECLENYGTFQNQCTNPHKSSQISPQSKNSFKCIISDAIDENATETMT